MNQTHAHVLPVYLPNEFQSAIGSLACAVDLNLTDLRSSQWTIFGGISLPGIDVFRFEGEGGRHGQRNPRHILNDRIDDFLIYIPRSALISITQTESTIHLEPGSFALCSTSLPRKVQIAPVDTHDVFTATHIRISGEILRRRLPGIDAFVDRPIQLRPGAGKIMTSLFDMAVLEGDELSLGQTHNFAHMLIEAVENVIYEAPEIASLTSSGASALERVRKRAISFIERNLHDPALDVTLVADYCQVSVRYLHMAFVDAPQSIGNLIRESRLRQCRNALRSQELKTRSITDIAMMWGFNDATVFGRAYKNHFGITPSQERLGE